MNLRKLTIFSLLLLVTVASCKKDDDPDYQAVPPRDRTEQQITDRDALLEYLDSHYFNASTFAAPGEHSISQLVITELPRDASGNYSEVPNPSENQLLSDSPFLETYSATYSGATYEYYILRLNTGGGESPHFTDKIRVSYSGRLMDETVFDSAVNPVDLELVDGNGFGVIEGWRRVFPKFKTAESFMVNGDNTIAYTNYGMGVMFLPSGLAYFNAPPTLTIPQYSNLIFRFELFQSEVTDHDRDGIPSYVEDLNNDTNVLNDDTDSDFIPNFADADDDNDGVLTINELEAITYTVDTNAGELEPVLGLGEYERSRSNSNGVLTIKTLKIVDFDSNNVPDYLQKSMATNYNE